MTGASSHGTSYFQSASNHGFEKALHHTGTYIDTVTIAAICIVSKEAR